ncbi:MAG: SPFH domain-containing protein [Spirochaetales bacterium]|nr:SPFH domain-containing protein [Spirochaetales bacterium]
MAEESKKYKTSEYVKRRKKLSGLFFEVALPNEYLVQMGQKRIKPILGGKRFKFFKKFLRVPASVETLYFKTDNANMHYQGIGIEGYASWRIDPSRPEKAMTTLDFFDEDDPMARTNSELQTICIEAVRHVISNMSIDDALKKKDEIAENLISQLNEVEKKWGIIFDQVGIESVRIMSSTLFENLQSEYRDSIRLNVEKKRLITDREIAAAENSTREETELERLETDRKIELKNVDNTTLVKDRQLDEDQKLAQKERTIREDKYRDEMKFNSEKAEKDHELSILNNNLEIKLLELEQKLLASKKDTESIKNEISLKQLEIEKIKRRIEQTFSESTLVHTLIQNLPEVYGALEIDNYSVLDSGGNGTISPVAKLLKEIVFLLKDSDITSLFGKASEGKEE